MKTRFAGLCQLLALALVACFCLSALAFAADNATENVRPRYVVIQPKPATPNQPAGNLQEWNGSFTYNNNNYNYVMVGANPSTGQTAEITTYMIPVKIILSNGDVYDPLAGGTTSPMARTVLSPLFDHTTDYNQGGTDLGATQYEDAFQRGNFWTAIAGQNYHILLGGPSSIVRILPELTLNVPAGSGHEGNPFGFTVAEVDINYFDAQISSYMASNPNITPSLFPMFEVANTYLTEGGCCVGGYHSANGAQTYGMFDYDTHPGVFSQDVSALSHEIGEWIDDPLYPSENFTPCGILEVGDPLEGGSAGHPYGTWSYVLHGFTYHLQDLVFLRYFGAPANTSVNDWWTFQNFNYTQICQQGS